MSTLVPFAHRNPHRADEQHEEAGLSSDSSLSSVPTIRDSPDPLDDFTLPPNRDSSPESELMHEDESDSHYPDDDAPSSDSLSGHDNKRRKVANSSTIVPVAVREKLFRLYDEKCWLCGVNAKHVAHVIAKSERHLFREYTRQGLLYMPSLHALENLLLLCPTCHNTFDERCPVWAFLPPLEPFIAREAEFQARRLLLASSTPGVTYTRPNPYVNGTPKLKYRRYQIRPDHLLPGVFATREKVWIGNPIATILRSGCILAGVARLHVERECGLPEDVARQLARLLLLYGTPAPEVGVPRIIEVHPDVTPDGDDTRDEADEEGQDGSGPSGHQTQKPPPQGDSQGDKLPGSSNTQRYNLRRRHDGVFDKQHYRDNTHKQGDSTQLLAPEATRKRPCTSAGASAGPHPQAGVKRTERHQERSMEMIDQGLREAWVFGPEMTSARVMDWWGHPRENLGDQ